MSTKNKKIYMKYVVEHLSEHSEKQNAVIFRKVMVGKPTTLLKKVFVLCIQVCVEGSYVSACVKVAFL